MVRLLVNHFIIMIVKMELRWIQISEVRWDWRVFTTNILCTYILCIQMCYMTFLNEVIKQIYTRPVRKTTRKDVFQGQETCLRCSVLFHRNYWLYGILLDYFPLVENKLVTKMNCSLIFLSICLNIKIILHFLILQLYRFVICTVTKCMK